MEKKAKKKEINKARRKNKLFIQSLILGNYHFRGCFSRPFVNYFEIPSYPSHDLSSYARVTLSTIIIPNSQKNMISSFRIITRMLFICGNWHHHLISFSIPFSIKTNKQKKKNKAYIRNHLKYRICWELRISTAKEQGFRLPPLSLVTINGF